MYIFLYIFHFIYINVKLMKSILKATLNEVLIYMHLLTCLFPLVRPSCSPCQRISQGGKTHCHLISPPKHLVSTGVWLHGITALADVVSPPRCRFRHLHVFQKMSQLRAEGQILEVEATFLREGPSNGLFQ